MRELAIRHALGAQRSHIVRLVAGEGLSVTFIGIVVGLLGASASTGLMQSLLFGIAPLDVVAFAVSPIVLGVASLIACLIPALRAAAADPAVILRS
jgi:ABC-type antimicrobial peptide transport system permease subunit